MQNDLSVHGYDRQMELAIFQTPKEIVEVDCPGETSPNLSWFNYKHIPRPMFPLDPI
jgi:hypothetical protein